MILLIYLYNSSTMSGILTKYQYETGMISMAYAGMASAILYCMKTLTIVTTKINDKTIKALEQLGYKVQVVLK